MIKIQEIKYHKFRCQNCRKILLEYDDSDLKGKLHEKIICNRCKTVNYLNVDKGDE